MPEDIPKDYSSPKVFWSKVVGNDRPMFNCKLHNKNDNVSITGMIDTGADVTIVSSTDWPKLWELQTKDGLVSGVGGSVPAHRSKDITQIEGPEGQVASIQPFVIDSGFTLWGRDLMSQWGTRMEVTTDLWGFP